MAVWLGVDVGGIRKGFDAALVDDRRLITLAGELCRDDVVVLADRSGPLLVAIDSPRSCAPDGELTRAAERALNRAVCGIRWTPDANRVASGDYYAWVREGLTESLGGEIVVPAAAWPRAGLATRRGSRGVEDLSPAAPAPTPTPTPGSRTAGGR
ncbi:MAG: hypothetical protein WBQ18_06335 [Solirubrobacteraceae bacterium]